MLIFLLIVIIFVCLIPLRRSKKEVRLLYQERPRLVGEFVVFRCGCRFSWNHPQMGGEFLLSSNKPTQPQVRQLCASHEAIIATEVNS